jgi:hypothetical protein
MKGEGRYIELFNKNVKSLLCIIAMHVEMNEHRIAIVYANAEALEGNVNAIR